MDDIIMRKFLENRNVDHEDLYEKFKEFMMLENYRKGGKGRMSRHQDWDPTMYDEFEDSDFYRKMRRHHDSYEDMMGDKTTRGSYKEHFDEPHAKMVVARMQHEEGGRKYIGEKFDMEKARELSERYKGLLSPSTTFYDVYVAINSQYHDYCELFKAWFGDSIDQKVIESAITFWFRDTDYKHGNKIWNYAGMS